MFIYSIWESVFLVSMALGFFYSWQTYCKIEGEVEQLKLREVVKNTREDFAVFYDKLCMSQTLNKLMYWLAPLLEKLEHLTGRGGNLRYNGSYDYLRAKKNDPEEGVQLQGKELDEDEEIKNTNLNELLHSDSSDEDESD